MEEKPAFLLIVKPVVGLKIWDTPRPQSQGAVLRRTESKGAQLYAYDIHIFQGVPYARLVPRDPTKPEWARVSEAGSAVPEYLDTIPLAAHEDGDLATALNNVASSNEHIARALETLAKKP